MEIIVEGKGSSVFTPNQVIINFDFVIKGETYEKVLDEGTRTVYDFIQVLIIPNGFSKEDLKTRNFVIREDRKYNEITRKYEFDGYSYNQSAVLKFDYNNDLLAHFLDSLSKLATPPKAYVNFGVKEEENCRRELLAKAYDDAKEQAMAIANAACKTLKDCIKVDFKPFTTSYISSSGFASDMMYEKTSIGRGGVAEVITNIFTPEDIELTENLYCIWITE